MTSTPNAAPTTAQIARTLDHALLHPTMTDPEIRAGCELARRLNCVTVCVKPSAIPLAVQELQGSSTAVGTVIGFPSGSHSTSTKVDEAKWACSQGATELDMVVNVGKVLQGDWDYVMDDIGAVLKIARQQEALLKVIFETDYVTRDEDKVRLCQICSQLSVDFVKTSTGFGFHKIQGHYDYIGATEHDIRLMRAETDKSIGVKASGGIRSRADAIRFLELGCTRLGTSASEAILQSEGAEQEDGDQTGY